MSRSIGLTQAEHSCCFVFGCGFFVSTLKESAKQAAAAVTGRRFTSRDGRSNKTCYGGTMFFQELQYQLER